MEAYSAPGGPLDPSKVAADTPVMMYCTGGIRCDVYSAVLKEKGFTNLYTLSGGVQARVDCVRSDCSKCVGNLGWRARRDVQQHDELLMATVAETEIFEPQAYLDKYGNDRWEGHLFVFDSRLAMTPDRQPAALGAGPTLKCYCCGEPRAAAPHRNCPNVDCNRLFLVCTGCLQQRGGFCCKECASATHVRPALIQPGKQYTRWYHYADGACATACSRSISLTHCALSLHHLPAMRTCSRRGDASASTPVSLCPDLTLLSILRSTGEHVVASRRGDGRKLRRQRRRERRMDVAIQKAIVAVAAELGVDFAQLSPEQARCCVAFVCVCSVQNGGLTLW